MNKVDLMFIKDIIEGYKAGLDRDYLSGLKDNPLCENKIDAADEILVLIQEFITEVNKL